MGQEAKEYCEISIEIFLNMTGQIPFDVYVQLSADKFTMVSRRNDPVDKERFESYFRKGAKNLYILRKDRREYIAATERFIKNLLQNEPISAQNASRALEELTEQSLFEIFEDGLFDENALRRCQEITKSFVHLFRTDMTVLTHFMQLCRNETYMVRHSIATSVISILLARASDNDNDRTMQIVGLGGLLHDLGMALIPHEINDVDRKLSQQEWLMVKKHPKLGRSLSENAKSFPDEVLHIVEQHHENYDGTGYPNGLKGPEIYFPARIVTIADCFSALTTRRGGRALYTPEEALALMSSEKHRYDPLLLKAFIGLLQPPKKKSA